MNKLTAVDNKTIGSTIIPLLTFLLAIFVSMSASGQEYIKEAPNIADRPTIVKEVSINKWMICYRDYFSAFFYVSDTTPLLHSMDFLNYNITINDFEIINNWVYFCGESTDTSDKYALVGKFQIATFPSSIVYFYRIDSLKSLTKIEVQYGGMATTNVYMIGKGRDEKCYFVSASLAGFGSPGSFFFSEASDNHVDVLDDIAYTDKYIVVTGRNTASRHGYLYYFYLPAMVGGGFSPNAQYGDIGYYVDNPILIKHCEKDYVVTVSSDDFYHIISAFDSTCFKYIITVDRDNSALERDVEYNYQSRELDLLVGNPPDMQQECFSYIYHFNTSNSMTSVAPFNVHDYTGENIHSIENTSEVFPQCNRFIATGGGCAYNPLRWYRYNSHQWKGCAEKKTKVTCMSKNIFFPTTYKYVRKKISIVPTEIEKRIRHFGYYTICPE